MMMRYTTIFGTIAMVVGIAAPSMATVYVITDNSTPQPIQTYGNIYTSGADMDGMIVDVTYSDNTHADFTWATTTDPGGGVSGGGFSLAFAGSDTFFTPWTLSNTGKAITDVKVDGFPGLTLFDKLIPYSNGTANSPGETFQLKSGGTGYNITATYSGPIGVGGAPPFGPPTDVYRWLDIGFSKPFTNSQITFLADTDNIGTPAVPEASSKISFGLLLALGLGGVMIMAKRKKARE